MEFRKDLSYSKTHEWVKQEGDIVVIGISDYAQNALGDLVYIELPEIGDEITAGESFGEAESVKAVSDINSPVSGIVCEINEELEGSPELINETPYEAWLIKAENITETEELMDAAEYEAFCKEADA